MKRRYGMSVVAACWIGALAVGAASAAGESEVKRGVPVEGMVVRAQTVTQNLPLLGTLQPRHQVEVVAEVQGKVERLGIELGERVSRRDTLARIDDRVPLSQYRQAQAQVLAAENNLEIARLNLAGDAELFENGDIAELTYRNSQLAVRAAEAERLAVLAQRSALEKQFLDTRVVPPIDGLVARKYVEVGDMVGPGTPLCRVVDLSVIEVEVGVPQASIGSVGAGAPARVTVPALNGRSFEGRVRHISPQAEEASGSFTVEVQVENTPDMALKAGMTARVELTLSRGQRRLVVPERALVARSGDRYAYRISGGRARLTRVAVEEVLGGQAVVEEGLAEGDTIVVVGMENLGVDTGVWIERIRQVWTEALPWQTGEGEEKD